MKDNRIPDLDLDLHFASVPRDETAGLVLEDAADPLTTAAWAVVILGVGALTCYGLLRVGLIVREFVAPVAL